MGISAIMILICHTPINGIKMPKLLEYILVQGQIGVDIFLLLSGMGLWYSLNSYKGKLRYWYRNRYVKLMVPYLIIHTIMTILISILNNNFDFWYWLSTACTIEFWLTHKAAWFVALLVPLYLFAPSLRLYLEINHWSKLFLLLLLTYLIALFPLSNFGWQNSNILNNIQFVMIRVPSFIL